MNDINAETSLIDCTADIVAAYVSNNTVNTSDLTGLISSVHEALRKNSDGTLDEAPQEPAVPINKSVHSDYIICLEDGKRFKSLKRHLKAYYGMTPEDYRAKWDLKESYPMVAPNYAALRAELAKKSGLGTKYGRTR
ncbi:Transcriptional regulatory protein ros [Labrenzia sp. THAF82]|uniref:MucR family transcriptional regulator n=1 Tax=Labrenzia sp. THAF82 TaxID=2587861 RepID=UPI00126953C5|nr:MucR family transcriptional regulator [Labrenzia sp. THAF82]QFT29451.1 Transcriptional regulatory protein ros [Labrenzia sp. THAF82]